LHYSSRILPNARDLRIVRQLFVVHQKALIENKTFKMKDDIWYLGAETCTVNALTSPEMAEFSFEFISLYLISFEEGVCR